MREGQLKDSEILKFYLAVAKTAATPKELPEIQASLDLLEFDDSPESIEICDRIRQKYHYLITGERQLSFDFTK